MNPITESTLLRSINLLRSRNAVANKRCEELLRESAAISQSTDTETRKKYNDLKNSEEKLSKSIQRRECKLRKLKDRLAEITTVKLV